MANHANYRNLVIKPDMWGKVVVAAAQETIDEGTRVSASEWVRRAITARLRSQRGSTE